MPDLSRRPACFVTLKKEAGRQLKAGVTDKAAWLSATAAKSRNGRITGRVHAVLQVIRATISIISKSR